MRDWFHCFTSLSLFGKKTEGENKPKENKPKGVFAAHHVPHPQAHEPQPSADFAVANDRFLAQTRQS